MPQKAVAGRKTHSLRRHSSGQAFVELGGRRFYLGRYGTPEALARYHDVLADWAKNGCCVQTVGNDLTVGELCAAFWAHAQRYYVHRDGTPTNQQGRVNRVLKDVCAMYGATLAEEFGPLRLRALRDTWIQRRLTRGHINSMAGVLKLAFRWACSHEMIPVSIIQALDCVPGLRAGRTEAKESQAVRPVPLEHVEAIKPYVSNVIWAMIQTQLLSGCRPGEVCGLRGAEIDRSGPVWSCELEEHKTSHKGRRRILLFGPRAQAVLRPFLISRPSGEYMFSPKVAETERHAKAPTHRRPDQEPNPKKTDRVVGDRYTTTAYRVAIGRGCQRAGVPPWAPNQLRHARATTIRSQYGLDGAQVVLGHARADVTEIYGELDLTKAIRIMQEIG